MQLFTNKRRYLTCYVMLVGFDNYFQIVFDGKLIIIV